jgi:hypothetical protein
MQRATYLSNGARLFAVENLLWSDFPPTTILASDNDLVCWLEEPRVLVAHDHRL